MLQLILIFLFLLQWASPVLPFLVAPQALSPSTPGLFSAPQLRQTCPSLPSLGINGARVERVLRVSMHAKKKKKRDSSVIADNREARYRYEFTDTLECGIVLVGTEVKSARKGQMNIKDSYCKVDRKGQLKLYNCHIAKHDTTGIFFQHEESRPRTLLAKKTEIQKLAKAQEIKGMTLVPSKAYFTESGLLKCEIAVCKGKNTADKRDDIKKRDTKRDTRRELKSAGY